MTAAVAFKFYEEVIINTSGVCTSDPPPACGLVCL